MRLFLRNGREASFKIIPTSSYVTEEELEGRCHMSFLIVNMRSFCRWLLMYGTAVEIESPEALRQTMEEMVEEVSQHYKLLTMR